MSQFIKVLFGLLIILSLFSASCTKCLKQCQAISPQGNSVFRDSKTTDLKRSLSVRTTAPDSVDLFHFRNEPLPPIYSKPERLKTTRCSNMKTSFVQQIFKRKILSGRNAIHTYHQIPQIVKNNKTKTNKLATIAFILSLFAILFFVISILAAISLEDTVLLIGVLGSAIFSILALVFGGIAQGKIIGSHERGQNLANAATLIGGIIIGIMLLIAMLGSS